MKGSLKNFNFLINLNCSKAPEEVTDLLYQAGCSDGILFQRNGNLYLEFDRIGKNIEEAVVSAIYDVSKIGLKAHLDHSTLSSIN